MGGRPDRLDALIAQMTDATWEAASLADTTKAFVYGSYVDEVVSMVSGGARSYIHSNHLYSPAAVTTSAGAVSERYRYDAYGKRIVLSATGATAFRASSVGFVRGLTGYILDGETGQYYARWRMYDGRLGQFFSRDPLMYVDGMRMYGAYFVPGETDPLGLSVQWCSYGRICRQLVVDTYERAESEFRKFKVTVQGGGKTASGSAAEAGMKAD